MTNKIKKIEKIPIGDLHDLPEHPFEVKDDESMQSLVESAKEYGILIAIYKKDSRRDTIREIAER